MGNNRSTENGQAIVLLVISIVVLLGFTALAIDGGMLYSDRRQAKNAADTAALAGAGEVASKLQIADLSYQNWNCASVLNAVSGSATTAAIYRADSNGYEIDGTFADGNGVQITCTDEYGYPVSHRYVDVRTAVTAETTTSFAHLLYSGPLQNYVESAVRVATPPNFGAGFALLALNEAACLGGQNGLIFSGRAEVTIEDGSAYTNCCLYGNGNRFAVTTTGDGSVSYYNDEDAVCDPQGTLDNIVPSPTPGDSTYEDLGLEYPNCGAAGSYTTEEIAGEDWRVYSPGTYTSISSSPQYDIKLLPGLYCLTGSPNALTINSGALWAHGVTIFVENGGITVGGGGTLEMSAPCTSRDAENNPDAGDCSYAADTYPDPALPYILIYMNEGNTSPVAIEGTSDSIYTGTIYSPDGTVVLRGTSDTTTFETQIVALNIEVTGAGIVNIDFDDTNTFQYGARLSSLE
jgi:Flp pilus assembly protein TadG